MTTRYQIRRCSTVEGDDGGRLHSGGAYDVVELDDRYHHGAPPRLVKRFDFADYWTGDRPTTVAAARAAAETCLTELRGGLA